MGSKKKARDHKGRRREQKRGAWHKDIIFSTGGPIEHYSRFAEDSIYTMLETWSGSGKFDLFRTDPGKLEYRLAREVDWNYASDRARRDERSRR